MTRARTFHVQHVQDGGGELLQMFQTGPLAGRPKGNGADSDTVSKRLGIRPASVHSQIRRLEQRIAALREQALGDLARALAMAVHGRNFTSGEAMNHARRWSRPGWK